MEIVQNVCHLNNTPSSCAFGLITFSAPTSRDYSNPVAFTFDKLRYVILVRHIYFRAGYSFGNNQCAIVTQQT